MRDRAERLLEALRNEYGHLASVTGSGDGREVHLEITASGDRGLSLATTAQIQQTCTGYGYLPYAQETTADDRTLSLSCHAGSIVRGAVDRVALDQDGLLVKMEGETIYCVALPPVGQTARRRLLMMRSGDSITIRLDETEIGDPVVGELRNHSMGDV